MIIFLSIVKQRAAGMGRPGAFRWFIKTSFTQFTACLPGFLPVARRAGASLSVHAMNENDLFFSSKNFFDAVCTCFVTVLKAFEKL